MEIPRLGVESELQLPASLYHSHNNVGSEPSLRTEPQLRKHRILNPLTKARDQTCTLMDSSQIHFRCVTTGTPFVCFYFVFILKHAVVKCVCEYLVCVLKRGESEGAGESHSD